MNFKLTISLKIKITNYHLNYIEMRDQICYTIKTLTLIFEFYFETVKMSTTTFHFVTRVPLN